MAQYYDGLDIYDSRTTKILNYLNSIDQVDREVFLLFAEFRSYRKVAVQTNRSYSYIGGIIKNVRNNIINLIST